MPSVVVGTPGSVQSLGDLVDRSYLSRGGSVGDRRCRRCSRYSVRSDFQVATLDFGEHISFRSQCPCLKGRNPTLWQSQCSGRKDSHEKSKLHDEDEGKLNRQESLQWDGEQRPLSRTTCFTCRHGQFFLWGSLLQFLLISLIHNLSLRGSRLCGDHSCQYRRNDIAGR